MRTKMSSSPLISPSKTNDRVHAPDISICLCQKRTLLPAISPSPIGNSRYLPSRIVPSSFEPSTLKVNRWGVLVSWISLLIRRSPCHSPAIEVGRNWRNNARSKVQHALIGPPHRRFSPLSYYGDLAGMRQNTHAASLPYDGKKCSSISSALSRHAPKLWPWWR